MPADCKQHNSICLGSSKCNTHEKHRLENEWPGTVDVSAAKSHDGPSPSKRGSQPRATPLPCQPFKGILDSVLLNIYCYLSMSIILMCSQSKNMAMLHQYTKYVCTYTIFKTFTVNTINSYVHLIRVGLHMMKLQSTPCQRQNETMYHR